MPDSLNNAAMHRQKLKDLRDDRNLADYSHMAAATDLLISVNQCEGVVADFWSDVRTYLQAKGVEV